jgi:hypothetical protein
MDAGFSRATVPPLVIGADCDCAIAQVALRMVADDVSVSRSFDLGSACGSFVHNVCPHSGRSPCECRLVVLILHDRRDRLATLIAHSNARLTEFYFVDSDDLDTDPDFESQIRTALSPLDVQATTSLMARAPGPIEAILGG